MSSYNAIAAIGETLVKLLRNNMKDMTDITENSIVLASPGEIVQDDVWLSLFLYQIIENVHLNTQEMQVENATTLTFPPIALDLYYMITSHKTLSDSSLTSKTKQAHSILGRAIQILNDNSTLTSSVLEGDFSSVLEGDLAGSSDIHVMLTSMSLDDMTKIWTTFQGKPFRTSVCYLVTPVIIDSALPKKEITRVVSKEMNYYRMIPNRG